MGNIQPSDYYYNTDIDDILLDGSLDTNPQDFIKIVPPNCEISDNDCKVSETQVGEESLDDISFLNDYHINKCPADGHCFMYAIVKAFNSVFTGDNHINENMLLYLVQSHTEIKAHLYVSCFKSKHALLLEMKKYILDKVYLSLFGDIVVFITAAALNVIVEVIEIKNGKLTKTEIKGYESNCNLKRVYVFKTAEHYDAIVPAIRPILGNDGIRVALAAEDTDTVKSLEENRLGFSTPQVEIKNSINHDVNISPRFCSFLDIRMYTDTAQVILQDYSTMHENAMQNSNSLNSNVKIKFRDLDDINENLDYAHELRTRKLTNDDVDKSPVADIDFLDQQVKFRNQYPKNLISGHLNINGLRNKFVHDMLSEYLLDAFFILESKLDSSFPNAQFQVPGFKHYRADRNAHGGGIAAYIRNDLPHCRRPYLESMAIAPVETIVIEIIIRNEVWFYICMYSPHSKHKMACCSSIDAIIDACQSKRPANIFVVGDLNINFLGENESRCLKDVMDAFG